MRDENIIRDASFSETKFYVMYFSNFKHRSNNRNKILILRDMSIEKKNIFEICKLNEIKFCEIFIRNCWDLLWIHFLWNDWG
jgi:hypothetical protein